MQIAEIDKLYDGDAMHLNYNSDFNKPTTLDELQDEWNLSIRTFNILKREGVTTLDRLTFLTEDQLHEMRNLGSKNVNEVITKLHEHGYKLAGYTPFRGVVIPGLRKGYQASREGVVMSPAGHELKPNYRPNKRGFVYAVVDGKNSTLPVDVMVLSAYYGYEDHQEPLHLDEDLSNSRLENLCWTAKKTPVKNKGGRPAKKRADSGESTQVTWSHTPRSDVQVYRTYLHDEVNAAISDDGSGMISVGGTTLSLTARQLVSLTKVAGRIAEVNALMGIG